MNKFLSLLGFDPAKHSVRVEMMAGLTTFLTMSYILAVNPLILCDAGMDKGAVFSATVIAAAIATMVMAFYAKMPFALASGMGINAFFAYTLVIVMGYSWQQALAAVFIEGIIFIFLTIFKVREAIVNAIPLNLRYSISVGIGLFIAFIGLKNGGLVVSSEATMTSLGAWTPTTLIAAGGILLGAVLLALKVKGALFYTIIIMTIIGIPFGVTKIPEGFTLVSMPHSIERMSSITLWCSPCFSWISSTPSAPSLVQPPVQGWPIRRLVVSIISTRLSWPMPWVRRSARSVVPRQSPPM